MNLNRFKSILLAAIVVAGIGSSKAKANSWAQTQIASTQNVYATVGTWANTTSGSVVGIQNSAADATSVLYFDVTPPWSEGVVLKSFRVTIKQIVAAADAAPTFVVARRTVSTFGTGTTFTYAALSDTESGCGAAKDTSYNCLITLDTPVQVKPGDTFQLEMTTNQSATGQLFVSSYQIKGSGY